MRTLSVADARANLAELVQTATVTHERFELIVNGQPGAVLLAADDYEALVETIAILANTEAVAGVRAGLVDLERGNVFSAAEIRAELGRDGMPGVGG